MLRISNSVKGLGDTHDDRGRVQLSMDHRNEIMFEKEKDALHLKKRVCVQYCQAVKSLW